jgi:hypothetical protein
MLPMADNRGLHPFEIGGIVHMPHEIDIVLGDVDMKIIGLRNTGHDAPHSKIAALARYNSSNRAEICGFPRDARVP